MRSNARRRCFATRSGWQLATLAALRQGKVTVTSPGGLNGRGTTVTLPDHPLFWAGFIVVGEP